MHKRLANYLRIILAALPIILSTFFVIPAKAQGVFSNCLLNASSYQHVSLGKPLADERLGNKANIKIGILPYYFSDGAKYDLSNEDKRDYYLAAKIIEEISKNIVKVEVIFLPNIKSNLTSLQFKQILLKTNEGWSERNLEKSTYGFVKNILLANDEFIDYSNLDSVILEGGNRDRSFSHAEAFGFFQSREGNNFLDSNSEFFKSVKTKEGFIDNAVLLDSHKGPNIIAHELFHNFGLTDLYGGSAGPGLMSLMSAGAPRLLNYERAVLGWFPIEQFNCSNIENYLNSQQVSNKIELNDINQESILLLKKSDSEAYLIEVTKHEGKSILLVYLLEQERRPPIKLSWNPKLTYFSVYDLGDPNNIGSYYVTEDFNLVIVNSVGSKATLNLIPQALIDSEDAKKLISESLYNREVAVSKASEAKAKLEIETKVTPTPSPTQSKFKQTTITCFKGKTIKKVTSVNPKCPAGYKKK